MSMMKITAGAMLYMLNGDSYPDPEELVDTLTSEDGTHPTVSEAREFLAGIDPDTVMNPDKEEE